jgi:hypothetical protein
VALQHHGMRHEFVEKNTYIALQNLGIRHEFIEKKKICRKKYIVALQNHGIRYEFIEKRHVALQHHGILYEFSLTECRAQVAVSLVWKSKLGNRFQQ